MSLVNKSYDVYTLHSLLKESLESKVQRVNKALSKISPSLSTIGTFSNYAFVVNEDTKDLLKLKYKVNGNSVTFSEPTGFTVVSEKEQFAKKEKEIVEQIIDALADNEIGLVESLKNRLFSLTREKLNIERIVGLDFPDGKKPAVAENLKTKVGKILESVSDEMKEAFRKSGENNMYESLLSGKKITVDITEKAARKASKKDPTTIIKENIVKARSVAKQLPSNRTFFESVINIHRRKDEAEDYLPIANDLQEFFTLTDKEKHDVIAKVYEKANIVVKDSRINEISSYLNKLAELKMPDMINRMNMVVGNYNGKSFAKKIAMLENEINNKVYANVDLTELHNLITGIVGEANEILAPQMMTALKRALSDVKGMMESGLMEDGKVQSIIDLVRQFSPTTFGESLVEIKKNKKKFDEPDLDDKNANASIDVKADQDEDDDIEV